MSKLWLISLTLRMIPLLLHILILTSFLNVGPCSGVLKMLGSVTPIVKETIVLIFWLRREFLVLLLLFITLLLLIVLCTNFWLMHGVFATPDVVFPSFRLIQVPVYQKEEKELCCWPIGPTSIKCWKCLTCFFWFLKCSLTKGYWAKLLTQLGLNCVLDSDLGLDKLSK